MIGVPVRTPDVSRRGRTRSAKRFCKPQPAGRAIGEDRIGRSTVFPNGLQCRRRTYRAIEPRGCLFGARALPKEFDLIIVGGGIAGLSAGMTSARLGRKTAILTGDLPGGQLMSIERIEGLPGHPDGVA